MSNPAAAARASHHGHFSCPRGCPGAMTSPTRRSGTPPWNSFTSTPSRRSIRSSPHHTVRRDEAHPSGRRTLPWSVLRPLGARRSCRLLVFDVIQRLAVAFPPLPLTRKQLSGRYPAVYGCQRTVSQLPQLRDVLLHRASLTPGNGKRFDRRGESPQPMFPFPLP